MLTVPIIEFAQKHGLLVTKDVAFGVIRGQLISISASKFGQYSIRVTLINPVGNWKETVKLTDPLRKARVHRISLHDERSALFLAALWSARQTPLLESAVNRILNLVEQIHEPSTYSSVVLWDDHAYPKELIAERREAISKRSPPTDLGRGAIAALVASLACAVFIGVSGHYLKPLELIFLNPIVLFCIPAVASRGFHHFGGRVSGLGSIWIWAVSILGLNAWLGTLIYLKNRDLYTVTLGLFIDQLNQFYDKNPWILVGLAAFSALFAFFEWKGIQISSDFENGAKLDPDLLKDLDTIKRTERIGIVLMGCFMFSVLFGIIAVGEYLPRSEIVFAAGSTGAVGLLLAGLIFWALHKLSLSVKVNVVFTEKTQGKHWTWAAVLLVYSCLSFGLFGILLIANQELDSSIAEKRPSTLIRLKRDSCLRMKHPQRPKAYTGWKFCLNEYGRLNSGELLDYRVRKGAFGIPWVDSVRLARFQNFDQLRENYRSETDIPWIAVDRLADDPTQKKRLINKEFPRWTQACDGRVGAACRLASYTARLQNDHKAQMAFLDKGCKNGDYLSCLEIEPRSSAPQNEKTNFTAALKWICEHTDRRACGALGDYYSRRDYIKHYSEIRDLYQKGCREAADPASCTGVVHASIYVPKSLAK